MTVANDAIRLTRTTHQHLLAVILTEAAARFEKGNTVRLLDAGCGNGELLTDLQKGLSQMDPERTYELYGFDVHNWDFGPTHHLTGRIAGEMSARAAGVPWKERLSSIATTDPWPYADNFFDIVVSNQVIEHVEDAELFFGQMSRTLRPGGFSVHLFPSWHCVFEVHTTLPMVHWPRNPAARHALLVLWSQLGLGQFRSHRGKTGATLAEFCRDNEDFLERFVHYRTTGDLMRITQRHRLRGSFRYTGEFYTAKIRDVRGRLPVARYRPDRWGNLSAAALRYVSTVTLLLEPQGTKGSGDV